MEADDESSEDDEYTFLFKRRMDDVFEIGMRMLFGMD